MIDKKYVITQLRQLGYLCKTISYNGTGSNHHVFELETNKGDLIVKFAKTRSTEINFQEAGTDTMFGGKLSLERESYLLSLLRKVGLEAPKVIYINKEKIPFLIVSKCPGLPFPEWVKADGYKKSSFLKIMRNLGKDFNHLHQATHFQSFGNVMENGKIEPKGFFNFADRYKQINDQIIEKSIKKGAFNDVESQKVKNFFNKKFLDYYEELSVSSKKPTLVITDMFGGNFFVDKAKPSGYFDVESCQAAPAEFELYAMPFFLFNFFDENTFLEAKRSFYLGYGPNSSSLDFELIDFFSACRLLELLQSYWGYIDGLRDSWGEKIKKILFFYIKTGILDYNKLGSIWRERDKQPLWPLAE